MGDNNKSLQEVNHQQLEVMLMDALKDTTEKTLEQEKRTMLIEERFTGHMKAEEKAFSEFNKKLSDTAKLIEKLFTKYDESSNSLEACKKDLKFQIKQKYTSKAEFELAMAHRDKAGEKTRTDDYKRLEKIKDSLHKDITNVASLTRDNKEEIKSEKSKQKIFLWVAVGAFTVVNTVINIGLKAGWF